MLPVKMCFKAFLRRRFLVLDQPEPRIVYGGHASL